MAQKLGYFTFLWLFLLSGAVAAKEPFAFGDFTWLNGQSRQHEHVFHNESMTLDVLLDSRYVFSFNRPMDDTLVGSTVAVRHNEFGLLLASVGLAAQKGPVALNFSLQLGDTIAVVPVNDASISRGPINLLAAMRYVREASIGYRWDVDYGLNVDVGLFMSYIGLFSYLNFENWAYQPSYVSDNTPFYFQGARLQYFPTERLKFELWLTNGWQSYAKFNQAPGVGYQVLWRPSASLSLVTNGYIGWDTPNNDSRLRLHSDNSVVWRYWQRLAQMGLHRAAVSITADVGGELGDGMVALASAPGRRAQNFLGVMAYHRVWFWRERLAMTLGGGYVNNPGRYLVLVPQGPQADTFATAPGAKFAAWDASATIDVMPTEQLTLRIEGNHRAANVPYFAGRGGITSPTGYVASSVPPGWRPDLRRDETRVTVALLLRL